MVSALFFCFKSVSKNIQKNSVVFWASLGGLFSRGTSHGSHSGTLKTEYTSIRYVPCITSRSRRCAKTFRKKASDNIYTTVIREAPGRRRQVQGIMILLYGAGGEPSGGEIPMNPKPIGCLMTSHSVWGLRTNNTHDISKAPSRDRRCSLQKTISNYYNKQKRNKKP